MSVSKHSMSTCEEETSSELWDTLVEPLPKTVLMKVNCPSLQLKFSSSLLVYIKFPRSISAFKMSKPASVNAIST